MAKITISLSTTQSDKWWNSLGIEEQKAYMKSHPDSKYAKDYLKKKHPKGEVAKAIKSTPKKKESVEKTAKGHTTTTFDSADQEDAYFDIFDKVRGKVAFESDTPEFKALSKLPKSHTIEIDGGECYIVEKGGKSYMYLQAGGEDPRFEKLTKSGSALKAVMDKADDAASKA